MHDYDVCSMTIVSLTEMARQPPDFCRTSRHTFPPLLRAPTAFRPAFGNSLTDSATTSGILVAWHQHRDPCSSIRFPSQLLLLVNRGGGSANKKTILFPKPALLLSYLPRFKLARGFFVLSGLSRSYLSEAQSLCALEIICCRDPTAHCVSSP